MDGVGRRGVGQARGSWHFIGNLSDGAPYEDRGAGGQAGAIRWTRRRVMTISWGKYLLAAERRTFQRWPQTSPRRDAGACMRRTRSARRRRPMQVWLSVCPSDHANAAKTCLHCADNSADKSDESTWHCCQWEGITSQMFWSLPRTQRNFPLVFSVIAVGFVWPG